MLTTISSICVGILAAAGLILFAVIGSQLRQDKQYPTIAGNLIIAGTAFMASWILAAAIIEAIQ